MIERYACRRELSEPALGDVPGNGVRLRWFSNGFPFPAFTNLPRLRVKRDAEISRQCESVQSRARG